MNYISLQLFGDIVQGTVDQSDDVGIHEYNNYGNFPAALLLIFRVSTGENWQDVMLNSDSGQACNNCTGLFVEGDTCGNNVAIPFYISFYIITVILVSWWSLYKKYVTWLYYINFLLYRF